MRNIRLLIEYDGTMYAGWQEQKNKKSLQGTIQEAIKKLTKEEIIIAASGRTDAGVHALGQVANFFTKSTIPAERFAMAINYHLPRDIVILKSEEVSTEFHSRYHSKGKTYIYRIENRKIPSPFERNRSYLVKKELDFEKMKRESQKFIGTHDFIAFRSTGSSAKTTIRTIYRLDLKKEGDMIIMEIEGNGFLYNMVRIIAGTLVDIGKGRITEGVESILKSKDRARAGNTAHSCGLFLKKVFYDLDTPGTM